MTQTPATFRTKKLSSTLDLLDSMAFEKTRTGEYLKQNGEPDLAKHKEIEAEAIRSVVNQIRKEFCINKDLYEELMRNSFK